MKRHFLVLMGATAMMFASSCQKEMDFGGETGTPSEVSFQVATPEIATRAYSDGQTATVLQYAVYNADGEEMTELTVTDATINGSTTVNLKLTTGNTYSVIFWAAAPDAPYTVDLSAKKMTVDYEDAVSNDEKRDAFYKYHTFTVKGAQTETIELKRPFAQLNIGTNDYDESKAAGYAPAYSYVKVPVSSELNLVDGTVNTAADVEFALAAVPAGEEYPVDGYEYLAMNYLLVAADKEVVDLTFGYSENSETVEKTRTVGSVPVQRNHRTNIYGQLFTSNVDINVEIKPEYDEEDLPETLEEKLALAAQLGGTVVLTENVTLNEPLVITGSPIQTRAATNAKVEVVLDLNGYELSYTSDVAAHSAMITVNSGNKLVVKDSKGTGKISYNYTGAGDSNFGWGTYTIDNRGGTLVVENGTIEILCDLNSSSAQHMYCAVFQYSGSSTINGGKISNPTYRSARLWAGDMTINGGVFEGQLWFQAVDNSSVLTINGGSFAPRGIDGSSVFVTNDTKDVALKVTGGTFETKLGCSDFTKNGVKGSVSGGVFGVAPNENLFAEGMHAVENDGKFYVATEEIEVLASTTEELKEALNNGQGVALENDIAVSKSEAGSNGYGATGISQTNGGVIDGQGNDVSVDAWSTWDSAINTTGGTIKNVNVTGGFRGIFVNHNSSYNEKVILENVTIDGTVYTISCDQGTNKGLEAYNSTFNGWTSYAATIGAVKFDGCSFGEGQGYAFCRPYAATEFVNCDFAAGYEIDARAAVTFENCTLNGEALTSANLSTLVTGNIANATVK